MQTNSLCSYRNVFTSLKLFYINNCLYIVIETFANINFQKLFEKKFHQSFDTNLENVRFLPHILLEKLTALPLAWELPLI